MSELLSLNPLFFRAYFLPPFDHRPQANDDVAAAWYARAAAQGYARAQNNLGYVLYRHGMASAGEGGSGSTASGSGSGSAMISHSARAQLSQAVRWFQLAAAQGHAAAQNNLGICYETGACGALQVSLDIAAQLYQDAARQVRCEGV
jgi:TPR repeat protein